VYKSVQSSVPKTDVSGAVAPPQAERRTGANIVIKHFAFPTGPVIFYGFDGSYLGSMQPPSFP
jgi:hypothetical protein